MMTRARRFVLLLTLLGIAAVGPASHASAGGNNPPDCSGAFASPATLWPRDHRYHLIGIQGVIDPEGDEVTIEATIVTQDELGDQVNDGGACPDALVDTQIYLRAEGTPSGNGRVYRIKFMATDSHGASSSGTVEVCVPLADGAPCSDNGQTVNSLLPCLGGHFAPTVPVIDDCHCTGTVYFRTAGGGLASEARAYALTQTFSPFLAPRDTCPANSRIDVQWHAEPPTAVGYRYKLDEPELIEVGPEVTSVTYNSGVEPDTVPPLPGTKVFRLRAVNQEFSAFDPTRLFQVNFRPETWVAGPDPNVSGGPWATKPNGEKYALLVNGRVPAEGLPGTLLGPDSVAILPAYRVPHRTFLEIYQDTVFLRHEFDTVHKASWVVFHSGGFDADSRYHVKVADEAAYFPGFPGGEVLTRGPANASPVGFRSHITTFLAPNGPLLVPAQSGIYPLYDPNSFLTLPRIAAYYPMHKSGRAYAVQRAEDGDGARDDRISNAFRIVEFPHPDELPLRAMVMVFDVDFPPELQTTHPNFRPRVAVVDTFYSRTWDLRLLGVDPDPYTPGGNFGGPSFNQTLRRRFRVMGTDTQGAPLVFLDPAPGQIQAKYVDVSDVDLTVPASLASGPATLTVELCDCSFCEETPGSGRCITRDIPVYYQPPGSFATLEQPALTSLAVPHEGPGGRDVTIRFDLAAAGIADVDIYNVTGQRVRRLASAWFPAGRQSTTWDRRDQQGRVVSPGIYFVRLRAADATLTHKYFSAR
jgi:flagellar hook capping protein FlgD